MDIPSEGPRYGRCQVGLSKQWVHISYQCLSVHAQDSRAFPMHSSLHCEQITGDGEAGAARRLPTPTAAQPWPCVGESIKDELLIVFYHQDKRSMWASLCKDKNTKDCAWGSGFSQWQVSIETEEERCCLIFYTSPFSRALNNY